MTTPLSPGEEQVIEDIVASASRVEAMARVARVLDRNAFLDAEIERLEADRLDGLEQFGDDPGPEEED